jgi:hypothetical protein
MPADILDKVSLTVERRDFAHQLLVHEDVFDELSTDGQVGRRLKLVFSHLAAYGKTSIVKGCKDSQNRGWLRTPVSGNHEYLWWSRHDCDHVKALDAPEKSIVVRAVRHHDDHDPLLAGDVAKYIPWEPSYQAEGTSPWTEDQKHFIFGETPIRVLMGNPGSGKTTALWEAVCARDGQTVLYLTWSSRLAEAAEVYLQSFAGKGVKLVVKELRSFWAELLGRDIRRVDPAESYRAMRRSMARFQGGDIGEWRRFPRELYAEIRSAVYGSGDPVNEGNLLGRSDHKTYLQTRRKVLGDAAAHIPRLVDGLEEDLDPDLWIPDLKAATDAARSVGKDAARTLKRVGLTKVDRIVIDEVQDLTLLEMRALMVFYRSVANVQGEPPFLLVAGDEGQTVVPTQFKWGRLKDTLREAVKDLAGGRQEWVSEHKLDANLRCPRNVCKLLDRASELYTELPRGYRPGDQTPPLEMQVHDARVIHAVCDEIGDGVEVLERLSDREEFALLTLDDEMEDKALATIADRVLRPTDAKGLEYQSVCIINAGQSLSRIAAGAKTTDRLGSEVARTAIDQLRVSLSRATGDLVFLELDPKEGDLAESRKLLIAPLETDAAGLDKFFEDVDSRAEERVAARLQLARNLEDTDLRRAWRLALECWDMLGDAWLATAVKDDDLRREVLLLVTSLAGRLIVGEVSDARLLAQAIEACSKVVVTTENESFLPVFKSLCQWADSNADAPTTLEFLNSVLAAGEAADWIKSAINSTSQRLRASISLAATQPDCAGRLSGPVAAWLELTGQSGGTKEAELQLRTTAFDTLLTARRLKDAEKLLECFPGDVCKQARWHEVSGHHTQAAEDFAGIDMPVDALRNWRLAGVWEKALPLASGQERENLAWLGQLEEKMAAKPSELEAWLTPAEKIRLKKVLNGDETKVG